MKILILGLVFVLFSSVITNSYAIDYSDSSGYTPSWAKGNGYHSVLLKCNELIGDYSRDGDWCMEWVAYVLDQGIENFPSSVTEKTVPKMSEHYLSVRECVENKICAFPNEFLKYKNTDTYDNFKEIAVVEFKEKTNNDSIRFFADGFGSKPLTYDLNLKTGIETHREYTGVNRPFNFIEPIPMNLNQQVFRIISGYYETTIEKEQLVNLKEIGLMDAQRTMMVASFESGDGGMTIVAYDKETGVLITQLEKYIFEGKEYVSGTVLVDTNIFSIPTKIVSDNSANQNKNQEFLDLPDTSEPKTQVTRLTEETAPRYADIEGEPPSWIMVLIGGFVVLGIPAIIIGLIIWKIKKRKK